MVTLFRLKAGADVCILATLVFGALTPPAISVAAHIARPHDRVRQLPSRPTRPAVAPHAKDLSGTWDCNAPGATSGALVLKPDGTYVCGNTNGAYKVVGRDVYFEGGLKAWYGGHAVLKDEHLVFTLKNTDGSTIDLSFVRRGEVGRYKSN